MDLLQPKLEKIVDRRQEHGLLVLPQPVEDVLLHTTALRKISRCGAPVSHFTERLRDEREQFLAAFVCLAWSGHFLEGMSGGSVCLQNTGPGMFGKRGIDEDDRFPV